MVDTLILAKFTITVREQQKNKKGNRGTDDFA
jgi:hypothetical protein